MKRLTITIALLLLAEDVWPALATELGPFFACAELVFFGSCPNAVRGSGQPPMAQPHIKEAPDGVGTAQTTVSPPSSARPPHLEESMWAEPVRGSDGQLRVYLPPRAVRDFLDKPTPENAREYLAWNQARMRQLDEAVNVMREVAAEQAAVSGRESIPDAVESATSSADAHRTTLRLAPTRLAPSATRANAPEPRLGETARRDVSIVYAFAAWCPYSRQQTPILNRLAAHVPVRGVVFDSKADDVQALRSTLAFPVVRGEVELRERLGVRSYPTIFFFEGPHLRHVARGLQPHDHLVGVLAALAGQRPLPVLDASGPSPGDTCQPRS
jgi:thiol-disulfide isomerase/thioredoxin